MTVTVVERAAPSAVTTVSHNISSEASAADIDKLVAEYLRQTAAVKPNDPCEAVVRLFEQRPEMECVVVLDDDRAPAGLVMRDKFYRKLSARFGASLYREKPIARLMDRHPTVIGSDTPPRALIDRALGRSDRSLYDCVVVTDQSAYIGVLTIADLLDISRVLQEQAVRIQIQTVRGMEHMAADIHAAVREMRDASVHGETLSVRMVDLTLAGKTELGVVEQAFERLSDQMSHQQRQFEELQRKADDIGQVTSLIRDLAEQSNLLAVNAAIEAARAGEQGRGFTVVADEVRKLAQETKRSANEINNLIQGITESVAVAAGLVRAGYAETSTSEEAVSRAVGVFEQLFHSAADNRNNARDIDERSAQSCKDAERVVDDLRRLIEELAGTGTGQFRSDA